MRFRFAALALLVFVLSQFKCSCAGEIVAGKEGTAIHGYFQSMHQSLGFSGALLAAKNGKVIVTTAVGSATTDEQPLDTNTLFEIASCTKPFTAIAILQLAEDGKLALDDPIAKYVPGVPGNCRSITIRHLVAHTSGIPGTNTIGSPDDAQKAFQSFLRGGPKHTPGSRFEYWNQGYSILSEIIARTSGESYTNFVRKRIFKPATMTASQFTGDEASDGQLVAVGRSQRGNRSALAHPYGSYGFQYRGMGGLVSTVTDLWKFDRALKDNRLLSQSSITQMTQMGHGGYGLGWRIKPAPDGKPCHGHSGGVRGFRADICRYPSIDGVLIVLSNSEDSSALSMVQTGVERILFGKEAETNIPTRPDDELLKKAKGSYVDAKGRRLVIDSTGSGLPTLKIYWGGPVTHGYLGNAPAGKPTLYMMSRTKSGTRFKADSELEFETAGNKVQSVSLLGLTPKLSFKRVTQ